jgi:curli biogenesis system outer membrane secretion channel CsgG
LKFKRTLVSILTCSLFSLPAMAQPNAKVDDSASSKELSAVKRKAGARTVVAIYEFRSAVADVQVGAAQEMFVTALLKSGAFAVAERQRLTQGVMRERQLNASGVTAGPQGEATGQIAAAKYVFEVVISESNRGARDSSTNVTIKGMTVGGGSSADAIGMDVRIVDVATGLVIDAVNSTKEIEASTSAVSGVGNLLSSIGGKFGRAATSGKVDGDTKSSRKEGVDRAVRACIEVAVAELARRLQAE